MYLWLKVYDEPSHGDDDDDVEVEAARYMWGSNMWMYDVKFVCLTLKIGICTVFTGFLAPYGVGVHSGGVDGTRKPVDDVV